VLLSFSAVAGLWVFIDTGINIGEFGSSSMLYVYGLLVVTLFGLIFMRGWVLRQAESAQDFLDKIIGKLNRR
jgi:hypothetical protein